MSASIVPPSSYFSTVELAEGVWAAVGRRPSGVPGTSGVVDLDSALLVVDAFPTLQATNALRSGARLLGSRDPSGLVLTSWHLDHWLGSSVLADLEIFGTEATRDRILSIGPAALRGLEGDDGERALGLLDRRCEEERRPLHLEEAITERAARSELYEMHRSLRVVAPNQTYARRRQLPTRRSAWLVEVAGPTGSDTMLFVPEAEVLFAGDVLWNGVHPVLDDPDLERWRKALDGVAKIGPRTIVPGHGGPVGLEGIETMRDYLEMVERAASGGQDRPAPPYDGWLSPSSFEASLSLLRAGTRAP